MARIVLNDYEQKIKELEEKVKELESTNLILQEYFAMTSNIRLQQERKTPFNGRPEFSQIFNFTIDLNLQRIVWLNSKIKDVLGITEGKLFLKNINSATNSLIINSDRKRFKSIINDFTVKNFGNYQSLFRFKHQTQHFCWVLASFEMVSFDSSQENYLQVQIYKLDCNPDTIDLYKEFIKTTEKVDQYHKVENLTSRQREILVLLGKGFTSKEIAEQLNISFHTVEAHRKSISKKTQTKKRAALISLAAEVGIL